MEVETAPGKHTTNSSVLSQHTTFFRP